MTDGIRNRRRARYGRPAMMMRMLIDGGDGGDGGAAARLF